MRPAEDDAWRRRITWLRRGVWVVLAVGVLAWLVRGADNPPDPVLVPAGSAPGPSTTPPSLVPAAPGDGVTPTTAPAPPSAAPPPSRPPVIPAPADVRPVPTPSPTEAPAPPPAGPQRRPLAGFGEVRFRVLSATGGTFDGFALLAADEAAHRQGLMEQRDLRGYDGMVFRFPAPTTGGFYMRNTRIPLSIAYFDEGGRFVSSADMAPCPDHVRDCPTYPAARPYLHAVEVALGDLGRLGVGPGSILSFP